LMGLGTALAWIAWIFVIQTMNPQEGGLTALIFFYVTLCLALVGTLSLIGLIYRVGLRRQSMVLAKEVRVSFRRAVLLSLGGLTALWLSSHKHLAWYWLLLVILLIAGVEYLYLLVQASRRQ